MLFHDETYACNSESADPHPQDKFSITVQSFVLQMMRVRPETITKVFDRTKCVSVFLLKTTTVLGLVKFCFNKHTYPNLYRKVNNVYEMKSTLERV